MVAAKGLIRVAALAGAVIAVPAVAQVPPPAPDVPTREEIERGTAPATIAPPPRLTVEGGIERAPCPLADPRFANVTITLKEAQFAGLVEADPASLRPAWEGLVGQTVPISTVCEIRDAAATILRGQGYLAAVQVPAQRIEDGVVRFDVLMAKLVALNVRGELGPSEGLIARYLEPLKDGPVFNQRRAERNLLLARELPGYDVRLVLRPAGTVPGEVTGDVIVTRQAVALDLNIQNFGSREVGRWSGLVQLSVNDLLGVGDRLTLGASSTFDTSEQTVFQGAYEMRIGSDGFSLGARVLHARTRPGTGGGDPLRAITDVAAIEASYPIVLSQASRLIAAGGIEGVNQRLTFTGLPLTTDRIRVAFARLDFGMVDGASIRGVGGYSAGEPRWRLAGSLELRQGISIFDASNGCGPPPGYAACRVAPSLSRLDGDPTATLVRFDGIVAFRPSRALEFSLRPRGQYAFNPLVAYEEYSGGNYTVGRGYDPGAVTGDSGIGVQAELRVGRLSPVSEKDIAIQPFVFFDIARTWDRGILNGLPDPQKLASFGGGLRAAYGNRARIEVTLAKPIERLPLETKVRDVQLLVNFTTRLLPWR